MNAQREVFVLLTPQEVSGHAFSKAVMGGYNMSMVDEFLDEVTDDYTALYKENAALKAKMKVLVEKVEDYRATEDSIRATLLTAQKMADSIVQEAEQKRDQMLAQAENDAREKIQELRREFDQEQERLRAGQRELMEFIGGVRELCSREMNFLDQLPQMPVEEPSQPQSATEPEAAAQIEEKILATFAPELVKNPEADAPVEKPVAKAVPEPGQPTAEPVMTGDTATYPVGDSFTPGKQENQITLQDLKFGRNYGLSDS